MGLLLTTVLALCVWIVLWAVGANGFDAFLIVPGAVLIAAMMRTMRTAAWGGRIPPMRRAWAAGIALTAIGLAVWVAALASTGDVPARLGELGAGLLSGAVVAFAVLFLGRRFDSEAEARSLRITVGLQKDLSNIDLSERELSGFSFAGKDLTSANLSESNLRGANFSGATLSNAKFIEADLARAIFSQATLDDTSFAFAEITEAIFTDARSVPQADFKTAWHRRGRAPTFSGQPPEIQESE